MGTGAHKNPIDRLSHADSVLALLSRVNVQNFSGDERIAVATVQVEALDDWLAADLETFNAGAPVASQSGSSAAGG